MKTIATIGYGYLSEENLSFAKQGYRVRIMVFNAIFNNI
jgi:hypothetical protein